jgi:hypothetical protein
MSHIKQKFNSRTKTDAGHRERGERGEAKQGSENRSFHSVLFISLL